MSEPDQHGWSSIIPASEPSEDIDILWDGALHADRHGTSLVGVLEFNEFLGYGGGGKDLLRSIVEKIVVEVERSRPSTASSQGSNSTSASSIEESSFFTRKRPIVRGMKARECGFVVIFVDVLISMERKQHLNGEKKFALASWEDD